MTNQPKPISESIKTIIQDELQQQPYPTQCKITRTYTDGYTDIHTETYGDLNHIETIGNPEINDTGILIFLNNNHNQKIVITHWRNDQE